MSRSFKLRHAALLALAALALDGCKWFKSPSRENIDPPAELVEFPASVEVDRLWSRGLGDGTGNAGLRLRPAYADGRLYQSDISGSVYALDAESGRELWQAELSERIGSGPGVGNGLVVVGGLDGAVFALDAESGAERWTSAVSSEVIAPPAIGDTVVVVRSHDGRLYGLSKQDGSRLWVFDRGVPLLSLRGNGSPLIAGDTVYVGYDNGKALALAVADGTLKWERAVAQSEGRSELDRLVDIDGELAIEGGEVYATTYRGQVGALALDSGRQLWSREMSSAGGVALSGTTLYMSDVAGTVWAIDSRSGTALWSQPQLAFRWLSTPAAVGDYVVVGDLEGFVHVLKAENGEFAGRAKVGDAGIRAAPLAVGNTVFVANADGELAALRVGG